MNILIVKLSSLGDVIHTLPALAALRRHYPEASIRWLVEEPAAELLEYYPGIDEVVVCSRRSWLRMLERPSCWPGLLREIREFCVRLRRHHYDIVIDLQGLIKSAFWVALARGQRKIGFARSRELSWLVLNEKLPPYNPEQHAVERYLQIPRYLGCNGENLEVQRFWTSAEAERMESKLRRETTAGTGPLVVFHPVSRWPSKSWPVGNFALLARELVRKHRATVVMTGAAVDRGKVSRIIEQANISRVFNWAGSTNLRELACLCRRAAVVVSTDSGPMHLAAAVGTGVVGLFGPTAPWRTGPYGGGHVVLRADLECSPCFRRNCQSMECMNALEVDKVAQAVDYVLRRECP
ncbi:MAG: lipopolysaccharide heptosyltransferase I [Deltaproteobacteria bacterium]|nr:lipopolysaccharide heptosyltransferase I [Deltaproteobacteria bacterium]MBW2069993.1 lipopolysaccharide heptosyltransferase I [Deltaproteobacteria bacterium]